MPTSIPKQKTVPTSDSVPLRVIQTVADQFGSLDGEVNSSTRFIEDLEADSFDQVELSMAIEDEFGIEISDDEANQCRTVGDAIALVQKLTGAVVVDYSLRKVKEPLKASELIRQLSAAITKHGDIDVYGGSGEGLTKLVVKKIGKRKTNQTKRIVVC